MVCKCKSGYEDKYPAGDPGSVACYPTGQWGYENGIPCESEVCQPPGNKLVICDCDHPGKGQVWNSKDCRFDYGELYEGQYHCIQNCPSVPAIPDLPACPKGDWYSAGLVETFVTGCPEGYHYANLGDMFSARDTCICDKTKEQPKPIDVGVTPDTGTGTFMGGFGELMKVLPYLIGVLVVVQIIGAFRK